MFITQAGKKLSPTESAARIGEMNARFLRETYPNHTSKQVARDTGAPVETVKKWLQGHPPSIRWGGVLTSVYGPVWVDSVMLGLIDDWIERARRHAEHKRAQLAAETEHLNQQEAILEARRNAVLGTGRPCGNEAFQNG